MKTKVTEESYCYAKLLKLAFTQTGLYYSLLTLVNLLPLPRNFRDNASEMASDVIIILVVEHGEGTGE